jgi:ligand-binding SRPBCC domain-containing protein
MNRFDWSTFVEAPLPLVWDFFADPRNLSLLTPAPLRLTVTAAPPVAEAGAEIEVRLRVVGIPLRWRARIDECTPERSFVDRQIGGPFRHWRHQHRFVAERDGTWIHDTVEYALPLGALGALADRLLVRPMLAEMFLFRCRAVARLLGPPRPRPQARIACA